MPGLYLGAIVFSLFGTLTLDRRFRLFFWNQPARAAIVLVALVAMFLVWDSVGIAEGVFFKGDSPLLTGVMLAPDLPLEELFFLVLMVHSVAVTWGLVKFRGSHS
jgi:lycopene cyclase domain-containing protein